MLDAHRKELQKAVAAHRAGHVGEALEGYEKLYKLYSGNFDVVHLFGLAKFQSGELNQSLFLVEAALRINPRNAAGFNSLGSIYKAKGEFEKAVAAFNRAARLKPDYVEPLINRASVNMALGRVSDALKDYRKALAVSPHLPGAHLGAGLALRRLGRPGEAVAAYDLAIGLKPYYAEAYNSRGNALMDLGNTGGALASYDKAISLKPDFAEACNNRGNALKELGRPNEALAEYERAIGLRPDYAEAYSNRGNMLMESSLFEEAITSYGKAIALRPDYAEAYSNRGNALMKLKRFEEALASYESAIGLKSDFAEAFYNRGNVLRELSRVDEAVLSYGKAIELKPFHVDALNSRGSLFAEREKWECAIGDFEEALIHQADHFPSISALAELPEGVLSPERASELLAIADSTDTAGLYFVKAGLLAHLGQYGDSFVCLEEANALRAAEFVPPNEGWRREFDTIEAELKIWRPVASSRTPSGTGRLLMILGASRSGKSTLERALCADEKFIRGFEGCSATAAKSELERISLSLGCSDGADHKSVCRAVIETLFPEMPDLLQKQAHRVAMITNPFLLSSALKIHDIYDDAQFIFLMRDDVDNAAEIFRVDYFDRYQFAYRPETALEYVQRYNGIARTMAAGFGKRALTVEYETLLCSPKSAIKGVYEFLGIEADGGDASLGDQLHGRMPQSPYRKYFAESVEGYMRKGYSHCS